MAHPMNWPSAACICVTRNRRLFLDRAVKYFQRSTYPGEHWLVVIDGSETPRDHYQSSAFYFHEPLALGNGLGTARNRACDEAKGADIVVQWDDDDWQHPDRITRQVETLLESPGDGLAFTSRYYWYHLEQGQAARAMSWDLGEGSMGATFAYWRDTWKKTPFQDVLGEDVPFQGDLRRRGCPFLDAKDPEMVVYMRHNRNGSALTTYQFSDADTQACRNLLGGDVDFYDGIGELLPLATWNHPNAPGSKVHVMNPLQQMWARHHR
jgi:glycosyltransferase involved in cell wall biosynthesis